MIFQSDFGVTPDPGNRPSGGSRSLVTTNSRSPKPIRDRAEKHRRFGTLETGLQIIPRSLVAPTSGAGGFGFGLEAMFDPKFLKCRLVKRLDT